MQKIPWNQLRVCLSVSALCLVILPKTIFASDYIPSAKIQEIDALLDENYKSLMSRSKLVDLGTGTESKSAPGRQEEVNVEEALSLDHGAPPPNPEDIVPDVTRKESAKKKDEPLPGGRVK